jgi:hypothetical protein
MQRVRHSPNTATTMVLSQAFCVYGPTHKPPVTTEPIENIWMEIFLGGPLQNVWVFYVNWKFKMMHSRIEIIIFFLRN